MSREHLRAGPPVRAAGVTLVPLERSRVSVHRSGSRWIAGADKGPAGVVVIDGFGVRAYSESGATLDVQALLDRVVGLRELLPEPTDGGGPAARSLPDR